MHMLKPNVEIDLKEVVKKLEPDNTGQFYRLSEVIYAVYGGFKEKSPFASQGSLKLDTFRSRLRRVMDDTGLHFLTTIKGRKGAHILKEDLGFLAYVLSLPAFMNFRWHGPSGGYRPEDFEDLHAKSTIVTPVDIPELTWECDLAQERDLERDHEPAPAEMRSPNVFSSYESLEEGQAERLQELVEKSHTALVKTAPVDVQIVTLRRELEEANKTISESVTAMEKLLERNAELERQIYLGRAGGAA